MTKIIHVFSGILALLFGLNFTANAAKTDFQSMLEKNIKVTEKNADTQPVCGGYCGEGGNKGK